MELFKKYKGLILLLLMSHVFLSLYGCSLNKQYSQKEQKVQEETAISCIEAINYDLNDMVDYFAPNVVFVNILPDGTKETIENREGLMTIISNMIKDDVKFSVETIKHENGLVVIEGRETDYLTELKELKKGIRYSCRFSFDNGKIGYIVYEENKDDKKLLDSSIKGVTGMYLESDGEKIKITECPVGQSAEKSGLKQGDVVESVEGMKVIEMRHGTEEAVNRIRGPVGTKVNLSIRRNRKLFDVELLRN
ncbi:periplasmic protease [Desulfosporosinus orientis DSM 765]|uniref:Periplasmic protease n=1 Tax=Desulfosporosinus orientis (strain ATCC 19365 / DSM 765 / NCIMB 8382 / VKM B-1628 / Singapore I) TaxID=768706 RepID=G7W582_DESOD|nr:PDZ domain-containing protein [Desulfosporosinus orientis]AET66098.1 periplasmic protease [Desulfosporosinus orientis DSM 765]